jgi:NADPH:quinone reductase-like Zn-dependent oxidoreductase
VSAGQWVAVHGGGGGGGGVGLSAITIANAIGVNVVEAVNEITQRRRG